MKSGSQKDKSNEALGIHEISGRSQGMREKLTVVKWDFWLKKL